MKAEIISVGSELTSGQNLDTNSQWLSRRLAEIGIPVGWHTTVADDLEDNVTAFRIAADRAGLVLLTGGLGPTQDDLTREALAQLAGVELVFHPPSFEHIQQLFARRHRAMPERNRVQAMFPARAEPIPNPHGTAPGIWMMIGKSIVAAMPGVPTEMYAMFDGQVRPRLLQMGLGGGVLVQRKINCFGAGESAVEEKLMDVTHRRGKVMSDELKVMSDLSKTAPTEPHSSLITHHSSLITQSPEVGITVSDATISLRIMARAGSLAEAQSQIDPVEKIIRERLGSLVFGVEDEELEDAVMALLKAKRQTVAMAESVTAGLGQGAGGQRLFARGRRRLR